MAKTDSKSDCNIDLKTSIRTTAGASFHTPVDVSTQETMAACETDKIYAMLLRKTVKYFEHFEEKDNEGTSGIVYEQCVARGQAKAALDMLNLYETMNHLPITSYKKLI